MRYAGKLIGLAIGRLLIRHPLGMLIGLLIGHAYDQGWFRRAAPAPGNDARAAADAYAALGIVAGASDEELRAAYRRLISEHHPDKVRARGGSRAELAQAEQRAREINGAYERIRSARQS